MVVKSSLVPSYDSPGPCSTRLQARKRPARISGDISICFVHGDAHAIAFDGNGDANLEWASSAWRDGDEVLFSSSDVAMELSKVDLARL